MQFLQFRIFKENNKMGNMCGCDSLLFKLQPNPIQPPPIQNDLIKIPLQKKYQNIVGWEQISKVSNGTDRQLIDLTNELQSLVMHFQNKNGVLSKKFIQGHGLGEDEENKELMSFKKFANHHDNESTRVKNNSLEQKNKKSHAVSQKNIRLSLGEEEIQCEQSSDKEEDNSKKSCVLSCQTAVLNSSLFTQRRIIKQAFYQLNAEIGSIKLGQWQDLHRQPFEIALADCCKLNQITNNSLIVTLGLLSHFKATQGIALLQYFQQNNGIRFKINFNGQRRSFPFNQQRNQLALRDIDQMMKKLQTPLYSSKMINKIYYLTGWIPEQINLEEVKSFVGVFERLLANLEDGNTLITFSKNLEGKGSEHAFLQKIDIENKSLVINTVNTKCSSSFLMKKIAGADFTYELKWEQFLDIYDSININWNPSIYDISFKLEGTLRKDTVYNNQYLITVPICSEDIEIRLFLQKHKNSIERRGSLLQVELYDYDGFPLSSNQEQECIRSIQGSNELYSDVFIFQASKEKSQYILLVKRSASFPADQQQQEYFTLSVYSFVEIDVKLLEPKEIVKECQFMSYIHPYNTGYGINSPYFNKNLHYALAVTSGCRMRVFVEAPEDHCFEINLIADNDNSQNITKINLENILNNVNCSEEKVSKGFFDIKTNANHYILMINSYKESKGNIKITLELYGSHSKRKEDEHKWKLELKELFCNPKCQFTKQIKWFPTNSGPRKRLKSNSSPIYYPYEVFVQFFKNPYLDKQLAKGRYQFFIQSSTFKEYFDSTTELEEKHLCEPPALSLALFHSKDEGKQFKIILDDAFYVPFGIGFWSKDFDLEDGLYRFIFPKMDKDFSKGTFGIIHCNK